jgi:hypothetical protein
MSKKARERSLFHPIHPCTNVQEHKRRFATEKKVEEEGAREA